MTKKIVLSLILSFILNDFLSAQQEKFYAIDGSEWVVEKDRDAREEILWDEVLLHIDYIKKQKLPWAELAETFSEIIPLYKDFFVTCRGINVSMKKIIEEKGTEYNFLIKNKINPSITKANNKEVFYSEDLRFMYNICLDQFGLTYRYLEDIVNYDLGISDKLPTMDMDRYIKNSKDIDVINKRVSNVKDLLIKASNDYKNKSTTGEVKRGQTSKKSLYYTFDGREYKTERGRDNYEQRLLARSVRLIHYMDSSSTHKGEIKKLDKLISDNFNLLKKVRAYNEAISSLEDTNLKNKAKKIFPFNNLNAHTASNKEVFYLKDIYDVYEPLLGLFDIYTGIIDLMENWHKEKTKNRRKNQVDGVISLTLDVNEQKDSKGFTHDELMDKAIKASDKLADFYPRLIGFIKKEKP